MVETEVLIKFSKSSELFTETGGVHSAAISDGKEILVFREDIGRHNAVDKVIGSLVLAGITLSDKILLTSGRISSEIITKVIYAGVPVIISKSAPTQKAIEYAIKENITLIGFARGNSFNIYSNSHRISFD